MANSSGNLSCKPKIHKISHKKLGVHQNFINPKVGVSNFSSPTEPPRRENHPSACTALQRRISGDCSTNSQKLKHVRYTALYFRWWPTPELKSCPPLTVITSTASRPTPSICVPASLSDQFKCFSETQVLPRLQRVNAPQKKDVLMIYPAQTPFSRMS